MLWKLTSTVKKGVGLWQQFSFCVECMCPINAGVQRSCEMPAKTFCPEAQ